VTLTPSDLTDYLACDKPPVLRFGYAGTDFRLVFTRHADGRVTTSLPSDTNPKAFPFNLALAIADRHFDATYEYDDTHYHFTATNRTHIWAIISVAFNHLHWLDDTKLTIEFADAPVA
jgi:hypothetical protein